MPNYSIVITYQTADAVEIIDALKEAFDIPTATNAEALAKLKDLTALNIQDIVKRRRERIAIASALAGLPALPVIT